LRYGECRIAGMRGGPTCSPRGSARCVARRPGGSGQCRPLRSAGSWPRRPQRSRAGKARPIPFTRPDARPMAQLSAPTDRPLLSLGDRQGPLLRARGGHGRRGQTRLGRCGDGHYLNRRVRPSSMSNRVVGKARTGRARLLAGSASCPWFWSKHGSGRCTPEPCDENHSPRERPGAGRERAPQDAGARAGRHHLRSSIRLVLLAAASMSALPSFAVPAAAHGPCGCVSPAVATPGEQLVSSIATIKIIWNRSVMTCSWDPTTWCVTT
jgi:hypothetical protein